MNDFAEEREDMIVGSKHTTCHLGKERNPNKITIEALRGSPWAAQCHP